MKKTDLFLGWSVFAYFDLSALAVMNVLLSIVLKPWRKRVKERNDNRHCVNMKDR